MYFELIKTIDIEMTLEEKQKALDELRGIINETHRMKNVCHNANIIINKIDKQFNDITSFDKKDWIFLCFATALQIVRQYWITCFQDERLNDKDSAKNTWGHTEEHSDRFHNWYYPSIEEIINNPVPFDAMFGSKDYKLKLHGTTHRYRTLGHDPILGWYFGTMNILTSTLTLWNLDSYHIETGFTAKGDKRDKINHKANLEKIIKYSKRRIFEDGLEGKNAFAAAIIKEAVHLRSDIKSTQSLPIPIILRYTPEFAKELTNYGLDTLNIETFGKQMSLSVLVNLIISCVHRLCKPQDISNDLYNVKTRKILLYSNLLSSSSNLIYTAISKDVKKLDLGGLIVTLYRIFSDVSFIERIKREFISDEFQSIIENDKNKYGF